MNKNTTLVIGKNKVGKTRKILFKELENRINNNENLFILDSRLEYYNHFGKKLEDNGYDIRVVNFREPLKSCGWDPISYVAYLYQEEKYDRAVEILEMIGKEIFRNEVKDADPFWTDMATNYFIGLSLILLKIAKEKNDKSALNFYSLLSIMNEGEEKYQDTTYLRAYCKKLDIFDPIYISLSSIINAPNDTKGSIMSVFKQRVNKYFMRPELVKLFCNDSFKVKEIKNTDKLAIFVIGHNPLNDLVNVLCYECFDIVNYCNKQMTFILDGFDSLPKLNNISDIIEIANHSKIDLFITTTNLDSLKEKYYGYSFCDVEDVIELNDYYEEDINDKEYLLPKLKDRKLEKFEFKKYVN